jgi:hypothetical protein
MNRATKPRKSQRERGGGRSSLSTWTSNSGSSTLCGHFWGSSLRPRAFTASCDWSNDQFRIPGISLIFSQIPDFSICRSQSRVVTHTGWHSSRVPSQDLNQTLLGTARSRVTFPTSGSSLIGSYMHARRVQVCVCIPRCTCVRSISGHRHCLLKN